MTGGSLHESKFGVYHAAHQAMCNSASGPDFALGAGLRGRSAIPAKSRSRCINDAKLFTLVEPTQKGYSQSIRNYGN